MVRLLTVFAISLILAYCSQNDILVFKFSNGKKFDLSLVAMILLLSFFCGLRTQYNDTAVYIATYNNSPTVREMFSEGIDIFE